MKLKRQLPQYVIGLFVMALGIVLIKQANTGVSPVSVIPSALSNILPLTFGNTTILFQLFCFLLILAVQRKINVKTILIVPLSVAFGYIIDLYMLFLNFDGAAVWLRYIICLLGIAATALGIVIIVGADLMLPAPDALMRTISAVYQKPLSRVKMAGDATWAVAAIVIELVFCGKVLSVWIGTVLSVLLTGKLVGVFGKCLPWLTLNRAEKA
ncbi:MAG: YitT family protein [Oscillospiraceae bacterium]